MLTWSAISTSKLLVGIDMAVDNCLEACYQIVPYHSLSPPLERATLRLLLERFEAWLDAFHLSELIAVLELLA